MLQVDFKTAEAFETCQSRLATLGSLNVVAAQDLLNRLDRDNQFKYKEQVKADGVITAMNAAQNISLLDRYFTLSKQGRNSVERNAVRGDAMLEILLNGQRVAMASQKRELEGELDKAEKKAKGDDAYQ